MNLQQLKEQKATYELYGTMVLNPELVNHLFNVAIAAATPKEAAKDEPTAPARKPRAKAAD